MKYLPWLFLLGLSFFSVSAQVELINQNKIPRWRVCPETAGEWSRETPLSLLLRNSGNNMQSMWTITLPELKKGCLYMFEGEIRSDAEWRLYLESGQGDVWENKGLVSSQKPTAANWRKIQFNVKFDKMPKTPYLVVQLLKPGNLSARNFTVSPVVDLGEQLESGRRIELFTPPYRKNWTNNAAPGQAGWDGNILKIINTEEGKTPYWMYPAIPLQSGISYLITCQARGPENLRYRVYLENNSNGNWQNAGVVNHVANGDWQTVSFVVNLQNLNKPTYSILMVQGIGEMQFRSFTIEKLAAETIANADFEQGTEGWVMERNAAVIAESGHSGNHVLELKNNASAVSRPVSVKPMQNYRLSYQVRGIHGKGDNTHTHFFRVYPVASNRQPLGNSSEWRDCMAGSQTKSVEFKTFPGQMSFSLIAESRAPSTVYIDNLELTPFAEKKQVAELQLDPPFNYRNGVFASNYSPVITGKVILQTPEAIRYELMLQNSAGNTIQHQSSNTDHTFCIQTPPLGEKYLLKLRVYDTAGQELYREEKTIHNYKPHAQEVNFNKEGIMLVNGKRFFHIGHWWTTERGSLDYEMEFLREAGFNTLLLQGPDAVLDIAARHDMKVIRHLPGRIESDAQRRQFIEQLKKNSSHPALLAYFGSDEPYWRGVALEPMQEVYDLVRKTDPYHPVWVNEAPRGDLKGLQEYAEVADIYGIDIYPVPEGNPHSGLEDKGLTAVGKYTDLSHDAVKHRKPVWMILQGFAWAQCGHPEIPPEDAVYPTYEQSRFMAYNAIVHGATGIQYHYLGYTKLVSDRFWRDLRQVTLELEYLSPVLTGDTVNPPTMRCDNPAVQFIQKKYNDTDYYIVINESPAPVTATFSVSDEKRLNILFEEAVMTDNSRFTLNIPGRGVKIISSAAFEHRDKIFKPGTYRPYSMPPPQDKALELLKQANWIWYPGQYKTPRSISFFKRDFQLETTPVKASLHLFADDFFGPVSVNGKNICDKPVGYASFDVTALLNSGDNRIELRAADSGHAPCGLLGLLICKMPDGQSVVIPTDHQWQSSPNDQNNWKAAEEIGKFGILPWGSNNPLLLKLLD